MPSTVIEERKQSDLTRLAVSRMCLILLKKMTKFDNFFDAI